ncbi:hypothetical protein [Sporosarcina sp. FSL K6-1508]|uniref:hypothetical protein n=1 Tax=Sporosarcina sp. FSL K6-1508 TaxID=2921553 RepID=UPI0030F95FA5
MITQPYFQTIINCTSAKERDDRIADLELRGFKVHQLHENVDEIRQNQTGTSKAKFPGRKQYDGGLTRAVYSAVLRKPNVRTSE